MYGDARDTYDYLYGTGGLVDRFSNRGLGGLGAAASTPIAQATPDRAPLIREYIAEQGAGSLADIIGQSLDPALQPQTSAAVPPCDCIVDGIGRSFEVSADQRAMAMASCNADPGGFYAQAVSLLATALGSIEAAEAACACLPWWKKPIGMAAIGGGVVLGLALLWKVRK